MEVSRVKQIKRVAEVKRVLRVPEVPRVPTLEPGISYPLVSSQYDFSEEDENE